MSDLSERIAALEASYNAREKHVGIAGKTLKAFDIAEMMPEAMTIIRELAAENGRWLKQNMALNTEVNQLRDAIKESWEA